MPMGRCPSHPTHHAHPQFSLPSYSPVEFVSLTRVVKMGFGTKVPIFSKGPVLPVLFFSPASFLQVWLLLH